MQTMVAQMRPEVSAFNVKAREAIANLRGKVPMPTERWDDLAGPVHGQYFAVAGATSADLLRDLHDAVSRNIEERRTLAQFRKDFDKIVAQYGWSYRGSRGWRTELIYRVNMRSAHMAGMWQKLWDNREHQPYLKYQAVLDGRTRPQHRTWSGTILPITDPFWSTHYPPNGWNCRCTVIGYSERDLQRKGLKISESPEVKYRNVTNSDGEVVDRVPVGIDPGWDHNVGRSWLEPEVALGQKLATLPIDLAASTATKVISEPYLDTINERWRTWYAAQTGSEAVAADGQVVGFLSEGVAKGLAAVPQAGNLESVAVGVFRPEAATEGVELAALGKVWPTSWVESLPVLLGHYRAALWDSAAKAIVLVPEGYLQGSLATVVVRPNVNFGSQVVASVVELGSASAADLADSRYVLLDGALE